MGTDHGEDTGAGAARGEILLALPEGDPFVQGPGPPGAGLSLRTLTTALARMMGVLPAELVLCSPGGAVLHANHPARQRLDAGDGRKRIEEEIRFLCVGLHLQ